MIPFINLDKQQLRIKKEIDLGIQKVLEHCFFVMGPEVKELEKKLAEYVGVKHCIACANGTDALTLVLLAIGIKPGDEIIVPDFTFYATTESASILGGVPVFCDIDPISYNLDPSKIEEKITSNTKAIIPVSLYGQCPDLDAINKIAKKHNIPVIEDAAQSFGATQNGNKSCSLTDFATTSFFPTKPLGCYGDGGAIFTNDDEYAAHIGSLRLHGAEGRYYHTRIGMNSRLDSIQAAILLEKIKILDDEIEKRQAIADRYSSLLSSYVGVPKVLDGNSSAWAQYSILVDDREEFMKKMSELGVPTMVHYPRPLSKQPIYEELNQTPQPISLDISQKVVSLPFDPYLDEETQDKIIEAVKKSV